MLDILRENIKMEIHAYDELYIESAQNIMGHMFDFAINEVGMEPDDYARIYAISPIAKQMERGNPTYVAGKTGPEIVRLVIENARYNVQLPEDVMYMDKSPEYWAGWALAYYQWLRNVRFMHILKAIPFSELLKMYPVFYEMDITKFIDEMDNRLQKYYPDTALKRYRILAGLSQKELAEKAGVPIRQIQLFEQRQRDIRKSQAVTVLQLSMTLGCEMKDLLY